MIAAGTILSITMGIRQSLGLFVLPIVAATGVSLVSISFALAIGQFVWGAVQPVAGALADQYGAHRVLIAGALLLAAGAALAPWSSSELGFTASLGLLVAAGTAAGSFAILIGVTAQSLPMHKRSPRPPRPSARCAAVPAPSLSKLSNQFPPALTERNFLRACKTSWKKRPHGWFRRHVSQSTVADGSSCFPLTDRRFVHALKLCGNQMKLALAVTERFERANRFKHVVAIMAGPAVTLPHIMYAIVYAEPAGILHMAAVDDVA